MPSFAVNLCQRLPVYFLRYCHSFWGSFKNIFSIVADPDPERSETFGRIRIRSETEINVSDPKLDSKKICKKEPYFQAEISWFIWLYIFRGSANACLLLMDPDPNPANVLRTLLVAKSRNWGWAAFLCLKMRLGKNFRTKKSFGQFLI